MIESIVAIVPAAGLGTRFSPGANKPFHLLLGKPAIVWSLEVLSALHEIKEIIPVLKESDLETGVEIFERYNLSKVRRIAPGGKERQDSVYNGLKLVKGDADKVLIHDGARPLVDAVMVRKVLEALPGFDGVIAGVPIKDTIKEVQDHMVKRTLRRETLWAVQTPQVFLYAALVKAYEAAMEAGFYSTDDAALLERSGGRVRVVMGSYANIKVTTPEDISLVEELLRERMKPRE
jgi:2-C-methyl-D-erythritol 4-phosphate cytidylyltransferase